MDIWKKVGYIFLSLFVVVFAVAYILSYSSDSSFNTMCLSIFTSLLASGVVSFSFDLSIVLKRKRNRRAYLGQIILNLLYNSLKIIEYVNVSFEKVDYKKSILKSTFDSFDVLLSPTRNKDDSGLAEKLLTRISKIESFCDEIIVNKTFLMSCDYLTLNEVELFEYVKCLSDEINSLIDFRNCKEAFRRISLLYTSLLIDSKIFKKFYKKSVNYYLTKENKPKKDIVIWSMWL